MQIVPSSVERLITELGRLPGVGPRTAERLAFHLLKGDPGRAAALGGATLDLHAGVRTCRTCFNFAENDECAVCAAPTRTRTTIAVVEEPFDVVAIEKTGLYQGLYHVLGGVLSPIDGVGPDQLEIASLIRRVQGGGVEEVILATNPSLEGESTAMYIRSSLEGLTTNATNAPDSSPGSLTNTGAPIKLTRLARGLPVGGDLEYADQITLGRALQGRQTF